MDGRLEIHPCVLQDIGPLGSLPKNNNSITSLKEVLKLLFFYLHKMVENSCYKTLCMARLWTFQLSYNKHISLEQFSTIFKSKNYTHILLVLVRGGLVQQCTPQKPIKKLLEFCWLWQYSPQNVQCGFLIIVNCTHLTAL